MCPNVSYKLILQRRNISVFSKLSDVHLCPMRTRDDAFLRKHMLNKSRSSGNMNTRENIGLTELYSIFENKCCVLINVKIVIINGGNVVE